MTQEGLIFYGHEDDDDDCFFLRTTMKNSGHRMKLHDVISRVESSSTKLQPQVKFT